MSDKIGIAVLGLGVMGNRMLDRLAQHDRLQAMAIWDPNPAALRDTAARHAKVALVNSPAAAIGADGVRCVYIASPPAAHLEHANAAFDAGLAVLCEKPLTVDFAAGRRTISRIEAEKHRAAVNFSLASSPGLDALSRAVRDGALGRIQEAELRVSFARWPREWQSAAGHWLEERREGGFTREVISHFVFVLQRALGPAQMVETHPNYPADGTGAERSLRSTLDFHGVPVAIDGRVGGEHPDFNRLTIVASSGAIELHDWFGLRRRAGSGDWQNHASPQENRETGQRAQLDQLVAMIEGRPNTLPSFAEALEVQETIEAMLGNEKR